MGFHFGDASIARLTTCHQDLQRVMLDAIVRSPVDFSITEGHRSHEQQLRYFLAGKSKLDPRIPEHKNKAMHLYSPSRACDIAIFVPGKPGLTYDYNHLCVIAGVVFACAADLLNRQQITHRIRWGGNWDGDGEIIVDQTFNDLPHFELVPV
jgi:peptidoglycan L-alanyl-D-glutamate endopeptidase CwlK